MRKAFLLAVFVVLTPLVLVLSLSLLFDISAYNKILSLGIPPRVAYAALPPASGTLKPSLVSKDARITAVENFFQKYNSSLFPYAGNVVSDADKYGLDYRLVPAIAMQESNLCKKAPKGSYNCWGFGIYGKNVTKFNNYVQAIDIVTKTLAKQYKAQGLETPQQIMTRYTPSNNGAWADSVTHFMTQLNTDL